VRQKDLLEEWLVGKQMTLLMQRADDFYILRRTPVAGYDVSFLITAQVWPPCAAVHVPGRPSHARPSHARPWPRAALPAL
jgi:hypothetical protein